MISICPQCCIEISSMAITRIGFFKLHFVESLICVVCTELTILHFEVIAKDAGAIAMNCTFCGMWIYYGLYFLSFMQTVACHRPVPNIFVNDPERDEGLLALPEPCQLPNREASRLTCGGAWGGRACQVEETKVNSTWASKLWPF
jgi:hypothetical protein